MQCSLSALVLLGFLSGCTSGENATEFSSGDMGMMRLPNGVVISGTVLERPGFGNRPHYVYTVVDSNMVGDVATIPMGRFSRSDFVDSVRDAGVTRVGERTIRGYILGTGVFAKDQFIYFQEVNGQPVAGVSLNTSKSTGKASYNEAVSTVVPPKP